MISNELIEEVKNRLVDVYDPLSVYLFGSYAWGRPDEDSDLDLLVVIEKSDKYRPLRAIPGHHVLFGLDIAKDIIVYTREEFDRSTKDPRSFAHKIKNKGKRLYAKA